MASSEEKRFPPSEHKLAKLRAEGVVPLSANLTTAAVVTGAVAGALLIASVGSELLIAHTREVFTAKTTVSNVALEQMRIDTLSLFSALLISMVGPLIICFLMTELFQTRFLFSFSLLRQRIGGLFQFRMPYEFRRSFRVVTQTMLSIGCCVLLLGTIVHFAEQGIYTNNIIAGEQITLRSQITQQLLYVRSFLVVALSLSLAYLVLVGVLSRISAVISFKREHSMTRAEVELENREMEVAPEMRRAVRDNLSAH